MFCPRAGAGCRGPCRSNHVISRLDNYRPKLRICLSFIWKQQHYEKIAKKKQKKNKKKQKKKNEKKKKKKKKKNTRGVHLVEMPWNPHVNFSTYYIFRHKIYFSM